MSDTIPLPPGWVIGFFGISFFFMPSVDRLSVSRWPPKIEFVRLRIRHVGQVIREILRLNDFWDCL